MDAYEAVLARRSIRRFKQDPLTKESLMKMIEGARLAPSGANLQPCEYIVVTDTSGLDDVFDCLKWAAYLAPEGTPPEEKKPVAYIIVLINRDKKKTEGIDDAAAGVMNILTIASSLGIGSCWLGSINRHKLKQALDVPDNYEVVYTVALGYPDEKSEVEKLKDSVKYWKDENKVMHVPKRSMEDIVSFNKFSK